MSTRGQVIEWDNEEFEHALKQAAEGIVQAPGVRLSAQQLDRLLGAAPRHAGNPQQARLKSADFRGATFIGDANFSGATFSGPAHFGAATFSGDANFREVTFSGDAEFDAVTFDGGIAEFGWATFSGDASFREATFSEDAGFAIATFSGPADFSRATFSGPADFSGATFSGPADFSGATFSGDAGFGKATFSGPAEFREATFRGHAEFGPATFSGAAEFGWATFSGHAEFGAATFGGAAGFEGATFSGRTDFREATFSGYAEFDAATFKGWMAEFGLATFSGAASFDGATFSGAARFGAATFSGRAHFTATFSGAAEFDRATFTGDADFRWATFTRDANFRLATFGQSANFSGATFEVATELGPVHVYERLWLDGVVFAQSIRIEASALRASFARAEFRRGADVRLRWAELWLEDTDFAEPSLVAPLPARPKPEDGRVDAFLGWEKPTKNGTWCCVTGEPPKEKEYGPRALSLRGARVASLTLSGVHLEECRFAGAHGLDDLGLERVEFPSPPSDWQRVRWLPVRWTRRQTIAEEHHWRAREGHGQGWDQSRLPTGSPYPWPPQPALELDSDRIAGLYRQLRKSREDSKDEPGANDFYYGEMEMRRRSGPLAERAILWVYWLVSGYGLRASRALLALAITIAVLAAIPLTLWGFRPDRSYGRALLFALQSSIGLLRAPTSQPGHETAGGQLIEIFLRLAGPLFFGLALLALRGRVKR